MVNFFMTQTLKPSVDVYLVNKHSWGDHCPLLFSPYRAVNETSMASVLNEPAPGLQNHTKTHFVHYLVQELKYLMGFNKFGAEVYAENPFFSLLGLFYH